MTSKEDVVIEVLFPDFGTQAGDNGNEMYLRACLPQAKFVGDNPGERPYFADDEPSLILMGGMSERQQEMAIETLMPYRDRLNDLVEAGVPMLFAGSAPDILGKEILNPDGTSIRGLGLLDCMVSRDIPARYHDVNVGTFEPGDVAKPLEVVGYKIQFTQVYGDNGNCYFLKDEVGFGLNKDTKLEGYRRGNLIATWLIGPLLPLNPDFSRWLLDLIGCKGVALPYEGQARSSFEWRIKELRRPGMHIVY